MSFAVSADAYGRFMGRYSEPLAVEFADWVGVRPGQRALDVGCGPGALTAQLVDRLGAAMVSAVDPSESFVAAMRTRFPDVDVRQAGAEDLPFDDSRFDVVCAQLVVQFMTDPVAGLAEMARVTGVGGIVAACVWDHGPGGTGPLSLFWQAVSELDSGVRDESEQAGARAGHLVQLLEAAGLHDVRGDRLTVHSAYAGFDEWWEPYTLGVGPAGTYVAGLSPDERADLQATCERLLPSGPFEIAASAWTALGHA